MFGSLFRRAQATVDRAIDGLITRAIVAIPFLIAGGFGTAALAMRLNREYGAETGSLILAGGFVGLGLLVALVVRVRSEAPTEGETSAEETPASEPAAAASADAPDLLGADRELIMAALTSAAPIALPAIVRTVGRNLPLLAAVAAAVFIISRDGQGSDAAGAALEPGE
jgi:hypothetical protein